MSEEEALEIIKKEELDWYQSYSFTGDVIVENQIGIKQTEGGWEVYSTSKRGCIDMRREYKTKEEAIDHMISGLRVEKRIAERAGDTKG